jgi:hypothetical protein
MSIDLARETYQTQHKSHLHSKAVLGTITRRKVVQNGLRHNFASSSALRILDRTRCYVKNNYANLHLR